MIVETGLEGHWSTKNGLSALFSCLVFPACFEQTARQKLCISHNSSVHKKYWFRAGGSE